MTKDTLNQRLQIHAILLCNSLRHGVHGLIVSFGETSFGVLNLQLLWDNLDNVLQVSFNDVDDL
jgi:hypothetical protein